MTEIGHHDEVYRSTPLEQKLAWFQNAPGMSAVEPARDFMAGAAALYTDSDSQVRATLRSLGADWTGDAATNAGATLQRAATWSHDAGASHGVGGETVGGYGESFESLRGRVHWDDPWAWGWNDTASAAASVATLNPAPFLGNLTADYFTTAQANRTNDAAAIAALRAHENQARTAVGTFPSIQPPPPPPQEVPDPRPGGQGHVDNLPVPPVAPAGAGEGGAIGGAGGVAGAAVAGGLAGAGLSGGAVPAGPASGAGVPGIGPAVIPPQIGAGAGSRAGGAGAGPAGGAAPGGGPEAGLGGVVGGAAPGRVPGAASGAAPGALGGRTGGALPGGGAGVDPRLRTGAEAPGGSLRLPPGASLSGEGAGRLGAGGALTGEGAGRIGFGVGGGAPGGWRDVVGRPAAEPGLISRGPAAGPEFASRLPSAGTAGGVAGAAGMPFLGGMGVGAGSQAGEHRNTYWVRSAEPFDVPLPPHVDAVLQGGEA